MTFVIGNFCHRKQTPTGLTAYKRRKSSKDVIHGTPLILDQTTPLSKQLGAGSCVPQAFCDGFELIASPVVQLSRRFMYYATRAKEGRQCLDEGCWIGDAASVAEEIGIAPESRWPYSDALADINALPDIYSYEAAYDHRGHSYAIDATSPASIRSGITDALTNKLPVVFGANIHDSYGSVGKKVVTAPTTTSGAHAQLVVGRLFTVSGDTLWVVRNSWGLGWGGIDDSLLDTASKGTLHASINRSGGDFLNGGYALWSDAYLTNTLFCYDFTVLSKAPLYTSDI